MNRTARAINNSLISTMRCRFGVKGLSRLRKIGILPSGSRIRNSNKAADRVVIY